MDLAQTKVKQPMKGHSRPPLDRAETAETAERTWPNAQNLRVRGVADANQKITTPIGRSSRKSLQGRRLTEMLADGPSAKPARWHGGC